MVRLVKMSINSNGVWFPDVVPVFVDSTICALCLELAHVLFLVAFDTKAKVYSIFCLTICLVPDFETFACSAGKEICVYDVVAAHAICSSIARAASPTVEFSFSYNSTFANLRLPNEVS